MSESKIARCRFCGAGYEWAADLRHHEQYGCPAGGAESAREVVRIAAEALAQQRGELLRDLRPHWDAMTHKRIWTADLAGVMATLQTRWDALAPAAQDTK